MTVRDSVQPSPGRGLSISELGEHRQHVEQGTTRWRAGVEELAPVPPQPHRLPLLPLVLKSAYRPFADVMPMYTPAQFSQATDRIHGLCGQIANPVYLLIVYPTPAMQTLPALWSYSHMRLVDACVPLGPL